MDSIQAAAFQDVPCKSLNLFFLRQKKNHFCFGWVFFPWFWFFLTIECSQRWDKSLNGFIGRIMAHWPQEILWFCGHSGVCLCWGAVGVMETQEGREGQRRRDVCVDKESPQNCWYQIIIISFYLNNSPAPGERLLFIPVVRLRLIPQFVKVPIWRLFIC